MAETTTFGNATQILEPFKGVKKVTIEEYFTSGHRTCQGCESALVMKLMVKAAGARTIVLGHPRLSARDAIHLAVMERNGVSTILSFDAGFDGFPGISRRS